MIKSLRGGGSEHILLACRSHSLPTGSSASSGKGEPKGICEVEVMNFNKKDVRNKSPACLHAPEHKWEAGEEL